MLVMMHASYDEQELCFLGPPQPQYGSNDTRELCFARATIAQSPPLPNMRAVIHASHVSLGLRLPGSLPLPKYVGNDTREL